MRSYDFFQAQLLTTKLYLYYPKVAFTFFPHFPRFLFRKVVNRQRNFFLAAIGLRTFIGWRRCAAQPKIFLRLFLERSIYCHLPPLPPDSSVFFFHKTLSSSTHPFSLALIRHAFVCVCVVRCVCYRSLRVSMSRRSATTSISL